MCFHVVPSGARHDPPSAAVHAAAEDAAGLLDGLRGGGRLDAARDHLRVQQREDRPWGRIRTGIYVRSTSLCLLCLSFYAQVRCIKLGIPSSGGQHFGFGFGFGFGFDCVTGNKYGAFPIGHEHGTANMFVDLRSASRAPFRLRSADEQQLMCLSCLLSAVPVLFFAVKIAVSTPDVFDAAAAVEKTPYDVSTTPCAPGYFCLYFVILRKAHAPHLPVLLVLLLCFWLLDFVLLACCPCSSNRQSLRPVDLLTC